MPNFGIIISTYGQFKYAEIAIRSALKYTPDAAVWLIDDGSPNWSQEWAERLTDTLPNLHVLRQSKNGGLTQTWNIGLTVCRGAGYEFACLANSDVIFTENWSNSVVDVLRQGKYSLVGPVTNAPGHCARQNVRQHCDYRIGDDLETINGVSADLIARNQPPIKGKVNGYCMVAKTETWWKGAHQETQVFNPKHPMHKNEDELQGRWGKMNMYSAILPTSFVFHYRGVTRKATHGPQGRGWFRGDLKQRIKELS